MVELGKGSHQWQWSSVGHWRGWGGGVATLSSIEFDRQLDKLAIWIERWDHEQRCAILEALLVRSSYIQFQFLWTVVQPAIHRDFMYTARKEFPAVSFTPISSHSSRQLHRKEVLMRQDNYHRIPSAHINYEDEAKELSKQTSCFTEPRLPSLLYREPTIESRKSTKMSFVSSAPSKPVSRGLTKQCYSLPNWSRSLPTRSQTSPHSLETFLMSGDVSKAGEELIQLAPPSVRFIQMPVRRHIQEESPRLCTTSAPASLTTPNPAYVSMPSTTSTHDRGEIHRKNQKVKYKILSPGVVTPINLPPEGWQLIHWYTDEWNDLQKNEFLHKILLKLDPRQHYFICSFLSVKQYKDFISLLPEHIALKILSYLHPMELLASARVNKAWFRLCNSNDLWRLKCQEITLDIPVTGKNPNWKKIFRDNMYLKYNWTQGRCNVIAAEGHSNNVLSVTFDRRRVASGSLDKTIKIWDTRNGNLLHTLRGHTKGIWCLKFFTKNLLVSGSYDSTIRIWNLRTGNCARNIPAHDGPVWAMSLCGVILLSGSQDRTAKLWDISRCLLLHTLRGHNAAVFAVDLSEDGTIAVTGSADRSVRLWDADTGKLRKVIWASNSTSIMSVSYSKGYLACSFAETILVYRVDGGKGYKLLRTFQEHEKRVECLELKIGKAKTGEGIIVSGAKDGLVKYWDIKQEKSVQTFMGHAEPVNCIHIDETRIVSASYDNKLKIWDFNV